MDEGYATFLVGSADLGDQTNEAKSQVSTHAGRLGKRCLKVIYIISLLFYCYCCFVGSFAGNRAKKLVLMDTSSI